MKIFNKKTSAFALLSAAVIVLLTAMTVAFLFEQRETRMLRDKLAKSLAYGARVECELDNITDKYNELKTLYAKLEQTKSEQKELPVVYLTFDDGPSDNTLKILDILDSFGVKATFFVTGNESRQAACIYRRLVADGHAVGNHTYSHEYKDIYASDKKFWSEYDRMNDLFFNATGKCLSIMRFPGGSNNTVSQRYCCGIMDLLTKEASDKGIVYFDWNVTSRDAETVHQSKQVIIDAVIAESKGKKSSIVLFHDSSSKVTTVEALPVVISALRDRGCVFGTLNENTEPIQFLK